MKNYSDSSPLSDFLSDNNIPKTLNNDIKIDLFFEAIDKIPIDKFEQFLKGLAK